MYKFYISLNTLTGRCLQWAWSTNIVYPLLSISMWSQDGRHSMKQDTFYQAKLSNSEAILVVLHRYRSSTAYVKTVWSHWKNRPRNSKGNVQRIQKANSISVENRPRKLTNRFCVIFVLHFAVSCDNLYTGHHID